MRGNKIYEKGLLYLFEVSAVEALGKDTQIIVVTHSPIIMSYPNADFIYIDNEVKRMNYKDTSHYVIYKMMLECPEKLFKVLFDED